MAEAKAVIAERGVERLSLRDVARRLGVSHQAPYKHFASRDHILAEVVAECFDGFARYLRGVATALSPAEPPAGRLRALGRAYFDYAAAHPLEYRLMFNTPLPDKAHHPRMMASGREAFAVLHAAIAAMPPAAGQPPAVMLDALFVWSTIHGLASILQSDALTSLGLSEAERAAATEHCLARIGTGIDPAA